MYSPDEMETLSLFRLFRWTPGVASGRSAPFSNLLLPGCARARPTSFTTSPGDFIHSVSIGTSIAVMYSSSFALYGLYQISHPQITPTILMDDHGSIISPGAGTSPISVTMEPVHTAHLIYPSVNDPSWTHHFRMQSSRVIPPRIIPRCWKQNPS